MTPTGHCNYGKFPLFVLLTAAAGAALSAYALYEHAQFLGGEYAGSALCNMSAALNCRKVMTSSWGEIFNIPLGAYGVGFYSYIMFVCAVCWAKRDVAFQKLTDLLFLASAVASLFSIFLFYSAFAETGSECPICIGTYVVNFLLLGGAYWAGRNAALPHRLRDAMAVLITPPKVIFAVVLVLCAVASISISIRLDQYFAALVAESAIPEVWPERKPFPLPLATGDREFPDYSKGNPDGAVEIVEFVDYQCPLCRYMHQVVKELVTDYPKQIHYVIKNFPLDRRCNPSMRIEMHQFACMAAEFSRCAGRQGKFWQITDYIMSMPALDEEHVKAVEVRSGMTQAARDHGIDPDMVWACVKQGLERPRILNDVRQANQLKLTGTPFIWINGKLLEKISEEHVRDIVIGIISKQKPKV